MLTQKLPNVAFSFLGINLLLKKYELKIKFKRNHQGYVELKIINLDL